MRARETNAAGDGSPARDLGAILEFMSGLWALDHALQSASKRMEARLGITGPQRLVVRIVGQRPGISPGQVSAILHLHPSTLSGILGRLERAKLIGRRADPADARCAQLHLTARGREVDATRAGTVESAVLRALRRLPPRAVRTARAVAEALAAELERNR